MFTDKYTFIVSSAINSGIADKVNLIDIDKRYQQTLDTIESIRIKVPGSVIILVENSDLDREKIIEISSKIDYYTTVPPSVFTKFIKTKGPFVKGFGEALIVDHALDFIDKNKLIGKRIFKLSGRYKLASSFDIEEYNKSIYSGKYAARINQWDYSPDSWRTKERVTYFETRLYSLCGSLFYEYKDKVVEIFKNMMESDPNWEKSHFKLIPSHKIIEMNPIHVEGITSDTGVYKFE